ncbi:MAG: hypothetical protein ACREEM_13975 [Blastocatellia bacterium]
MRKKKRNFSSFDLAGSFKELGITRLNVWRIKASPVAPSKFYHDRLRRLEVAFDMTTSESAKELLIDAICEEALVRHPMIKVWKAVPVQSEDLTGTVDYVAAPQRRYLDNPLLCVVEAKKDDFEQGLAQCLVEMKACQWSNEQAGKRIDIYGIVTNGEGWKFYRLTTEKQVYESRLYSFLGEIAQILGNLSSIFAQCEKNATLFLNAV